jgi:3-deoxy-D-manno-octulosonate 8-phosphate phosphatase (KDO 8-P phosphatase)
VKRVMQSPTHFILDVDGVMTDGKFTYSKWGKKSKVFGPDDNDALKLISRHIPVLFLTSDKRGFKISKRRIVKDMGFTLNYVPALERLDWLVDNFDLNTVIYMGDSFLDASILKKVLIGIAPANSNHLAIASADYVTKCSGAERAVAEACLYIAKIFELEILRD